MSNVSGLSGSSSGSTFSFGTPTGPLTVATALAELRRHPTSTVAITDSVQNILRNLDNLQNFAGKITAISTDDAVKKIQVSAAQYQKDGAALALWGAGTDQTVGVYGIKASSAKGLANAAASYVTSFAVTDLSLNIQQNLADLETLASNGKLSEIVHTGSSGNLTLTTAQLSANQTALGKIRNQAYTLSIINATVSDTLGFGSNPALATNAKVKSIAIADTTDAIGDNLDALQKVGLRLKSIRQTDAENPLTVTADQTKQDKAVLGKIITKYDLAVINASATQVAALARNDKVVTVAVKDTAAQLARNWSLLQRLSDSLTSIEVTDQSNAITITSDQLSASEELLGKFTDTAEHSYKLAVTSVTAGTALSIASFHNVDTVDVTDTGDNLASSLVDLQTLTDQNQLKGLTLSGSKKLITLDASLLVGDAFTATRAVLDQIRGGHYNLAATAAAAADLPSLALNSHVVSVAVKDNSDNLTASLDTLAQLGHRLTMIEQTDNGTAFDLTQSQLDTRGSVLAKIIGGYTANLTGVRASRAAANANNIHVGSITIADTGAHILSQWNALRSLGASLTSITKTDNDPLTISAAKYQLGLQDNLLSKFDSSTTYSVFGATVNEATTIASSDAVTQIDIADESSALVDNMATLATLAGGTKLATITNLTPGQSIALHESQLADAQPVLDLIKSGNYTLALDQVDVANAKDLLAANHRIATMAVTGDSASLVDNLADLTTLGSKVTTITQTDADALALTGSVFERNSGSLAKILGGYTANLTSVSAAKAAVYAANTSVNTLQVSDTGSRLARVWATLNTMGEKLTGVTQSDSTTLQLGINDWLAGQGLRAKFESDPTVSISGAELSQVSDLADDSAVEAIQVTDSAEAIKAALTDLAAQSKVTEITLTDPSVALELTAQDYTDSAAVFALVKAGQYQVELSEVSATDAATYASDTHVAAMAVNDSSSAVAAQFDTLATATNLTAIALSDEGGTLALSSTQILANAETLAKFTTDYALSATDVALTDLAEIQAIPQVSAIGISDTAENVNNNFSDLLALGDTLSQVHLTDASPVLSLEQIAWTSGASVLAKIDAAYEVDVASVAAADAATVAADTSVRHVDVADTAINLVDQWDTLVSLYNDGAGKLTSLALTDTSPLTITADQQTSGAAMIAGLLSDQSFLIV